MNWLLPILLPVAPQKSHRFTWTSFPVALWPKRFRLMLKSTALGTDALGCPTPWKANLAKCEVDWLRMAFPERHRTPQVRTFRDTRNHTLFFSHFETVSEWIIWRPKIHIFGRIYRWLKCGRSSRYVKISSCPVEESAIFFCAGDWGAQGPESCVPMIKGAFAVITCFSHKWLYKDFFKT